MALALRLTGWTLFLVGAALMLALENNVPGLIVAGVGILFTMTCRIIPIYAEMSRKAPPVDPLTAESAERAREIIRRKTSKTRSSPTSPPTKPD